MTAALTTLPRKTELSSHQRSWTPTLGLFAGEAVLSQAIPSLANLLFVVAAAALGLQLLNSERYAAYWELNFWCWAADPFLRRLVDWHGGYHANSPVLLAGPIVSALGILAMRRQARLSRNFALVLGITGAAMAWALVEGLVSNGFSAAAVEALQWVTPLLGSLPFILIPEARSQLHDLVPALARRATLIIGAYGLVQFLVLPAWDATWMRNVAAILNSIGSPTPLQVRVFSLAASPGPMASLLGVLLLIVAVTRRGLTDIVILGFGLATFGLSQVRAAWVAWAVSLALLACLRRVNMLPTIAVLVLLTAAALAIPSPVSQSISGRVNQTTSSGTQDVSLQARLSFQEQQLPEAVTNPLGFGFGSTGAGARAGGNEQLESFANTDSGYLEALHVFGAVFGLVFLAGFVCLTFGALFRAAATVRSARRPAPWQLLHAAFGASAASFTVSMLFGIALTAEDGLLLWSGLALVFAPGSELLVRCAPTGGVVHDDAGVTHLAGRKDGALSGSVRECT